jgi:hypothetical protein
MRADLIVYFEFEHLPQVEALLKVVKETLDDRLVAYATSLYGEDGKPFMHIDGGSAGVTS